MKGLLVCQIKLSDWYSHPLEVVDRWCGPQLQVSENYSDLLDKMEVNKLEILLSDVIFIFHVFRSWYLMCKEKFKKTNIIRTGGCRVFDFDLI